MKKDISIGKWGFSLYATKKPNVSTIGTTNECVGDSLYEFLPYIDYDNVNIEVIMRDIRRLHNAFDLCTFVILCSREEEYNDELSKGKTIGSYMVICPCKCKIDEVRELLQNTRCDPKYRTVGINRYAGRNWVLRCEKKIRDNDQVELRPEPFLKQVVVFGKCARVHSTAHMIFLDNWYDVDFKHCVHSQDNHTEVEFIEYSTVDKNDVKLNSIKIKKVRT